MPRPGKKDPIRVFYSYSHRDSRLRQQLEKHLSLLKRENLVDDWYDGKIIAGEDIDDEIDRNLARSNLILLLISPDFLSSDYCFGREMREALKRHSRGSARVIPLILKPMEDGWQQTIFGRLKALPADGRPVTKWRNRDEAWADVANGIRGAIIEMVGRASSGARPKRSRRSKLWK